MNRLRAFTTDTAYRIRSKEGSAEQLVFGFLNGLTALTAELEGRHYGGGVLELIPSEIEKLHVPVPSKIKPRAADLDKTLRSMPMDSALELQTKDILGSMGLPEKCQDELLCGWWHLRNIPPTEKSIAQRIENTESEQVSILNRCELLLKF